MLENIYLNYSTEASFLATSNGREYFKLRKRIYIKPTAIIILNEKKLVFPLRTEKKDICFHHYFYSKHYAESLG